MNTKYHPNKPCAASSINSISDIGSSPLPGERSDSRRTQTQSGRPPAPHPPHSARPQLLSPTNHGAGTADFRRQEGSARAPGARSSYEQPQQQSSEALVRRKSSCRRKTARRRADQQHQPQRRSFRRLLRERERERGKQE